jgi:hypothetical protein
MLSKLFWIVRIFIKNFRKIDEQNILGWVWSSYEGAGCHVNVSNARIESSSYPLHEFEAEIDCPGMISEAAYRGYNYPDGIVPADLHLKGNFSSARYN